MEIHPVDVLAMMDRIIDATPETEVRTTWEGFRLRLQGTVPTVMVQQLMIPGEEGDRTTESLQDSIEGLKQQVSDLIAEKTELESQIAELHERLRQINSPMCPDNGFYTMEQFLAVLMGKLRRSYGWRTDYVCASQHTEGCRPVANEMVQKWQNSDKVPIWAVDQIDKLSYRKRTSTCGTPWSNDNEIYLRDCYLADPSRSNQVLAELCEKHFGRPINVPSIKGALDRLRKRQEIPRKRPARLKV